MYSLLTEFRDGDNVVTTMMEHNSNYVPWYAMCREILPQLGRRVHYRLARFDPLTGELDLDHLASLIDARTKLVCCTGASNFLGTRPPLRHVRALADASGYLQPCGERRSYLLVDGAQLVPGSFTDVAALGADYLAFSFHKMLAPFGVGVLYARPDLLAASRPFLYGGDMIAEGRVFPERVEYNDLPWKYSAGTPDILGAIVSARALRLLLDLALTPKRLAHFGTGRPLDRAAVRAAMDRVAAWNQQLTSQALDGLAAVPRITIYGLRDAARRTSLVAFNLAGRDPVGVADALNRAGVESRAGCHCATLAHHALGLTPPASCRLSFYMYNTPAEVDRVVDAVAAIAVGRPDPNGLGRRRRVRPGRCAAAGALRHRAIPRRFRRRTQPNGMNNADDRPVSRARSSRRDHGPVLASEHGRPYGPRHGALRRWPPFPDGNRTPAPRRPGAAPPGSPPRVREVRCLAADSARGRPLGVDQDCAAAPRSGAAGYRWGGSGFGVVCGGQLGGLTSCNEGKKLNVHRYRNTRGHRDHRAHRPGSASMTAPSGGDGYINSTVDYTRDRVRGSTVSEPDQASCFLLMRCWAIEVFSPSSGMMTHAAR